VAKVKSKEPLGEIENALPPPIVTAFAPGRMSRAFNHRGGFKARPVIL